MTIEKSYWRAATQRKVLETSWYIPHDIAFNPDNHFYFGDVEAYVEKFQLIMFLHAPDDKTQVTFRFWTVHEQMFDGPWNLFTGRLVGWLSLSHKPLEQLIELVQQHTHDLIDISEPEPIFQLLLASGHPLYFTVREPSSRYYLHNTAHLTGLVDPQQTDTFLLLSGSRDLYLKTIQAPRGITTTEDFWRASDNSYGSLVLTKRGAEEFCEILRKRQ